MLQIIPLSVAEAEDFLKKHDRHYVEPAEKVAAIGVGTPKGKTIEVTTFASASREYRAGMYEEGGPSELHGAAILGRNEAGEGCLAHIYVDGVSQGYSLLYGACWRALKALGYRTAVL